MKRIIDKFRSLTRYGVAVFLAAFSCFSGFGDTYAGPCTYTWTTSPEDDGVWGWMVNCQGTVNAYTFIPSDGMIDDGNGCTNCTAMTPDECLSIKGNIETQLGTIDTESYDLQTAIDALGSSISYHSNQILNYQSEVEELKTIIGSAKEDLFTTINSASIEATYSGYDNIVMLLDFSFDQVVQIDSALSSYPSSYDVDISYLQDQVDYAKSKVDSISDAKDNVRSVLGDMNCAACSSGSGSGSGSSTNSTPSNPVSGCPCQELLLGIQQVLQDIKQDVGYIREDVSEIRTKVNFIYSELQRIGGYIDQLGKWIGDIKDYTFEIKNILGRWDDYLEDDLKEKISNFDQKWVAFPTNFFTFADLLKSSNWTHKVEIVDEQFKALTNLNVRIPGLFIDQSYSNASHFVTDDGVDIDWLEKGRTILNPVGDAVIDFGEYTSLSWFQRMEFLLGHLAGIFSTTNSTAADFTSEQKEDIKQVRNDSAWSASSYDATKSILESMIDSVSRCINSLNPFDGIFTDTSAPNTITILPDVSVESELLQNTFPTVQIDLRKKGDGQFSLADIIELSHNITTFLAFVFFVIFDIVAVYRFVLALISIHRWYWKIYNSWVSTMFNGGGR